MTTPSIHVRVVSKRAGAGAAASAPGETVVDVDRTHPVLGNPFVLRDHHDDVERGRVIERYREKLVADVAVQGPMHQALTGLSQRAAGGERLALRCWCAPKPCHAELLRGEIFRRLDLKDPMDLPEDQETHVIPRHKQMGLF